jgi:hypothetical protein
MAPLPSQLSAPSRSVTLPRSSRSDFVHNTIRSRLAKVERLTGLDTRRVIDVMELLTVMKLSRMTDSRGTERTADQN